MKLEAMREWAPTIGSFCAVAVATIAIFTYMQSEHAQLRDAMREMRTEMRAGFSAMRDAMREEHGELREEHGEMRGRLNSLDRRAARIEGHLFGIEVAPEPADGE